MWLCGPWIWDYFSWVWIFWSLHLRHEKGFVCPWLSHLSLPSCGFQRFFLPHGILPRRELGWVSSVKCERWGAGTRAISCQLFVSEQSLEEQLEMTVNTIGQLRSGTCGDLLVLWASFAGGVIVVPPWQPYWLWEKVCLTLTAQARWGFWICLQAVAHISH